MQFNICHVWNMKLKYSTIEEPQNRISSQGKGKSTEPSPKLKQVWGGAEEEGVAVTVRTVLNEVKQCKLTMKEKGCLSREVEMINEEPNGNSRTENTVPEIKQSLTWTSRLSGNGREKAEMGQQKHIRMSNGLNISKFDERWKCTDRRWLKRVTLSTDSEACADFFTLLKTRG